MIDMPVCEHAVPVKLSCWLCKRKVKEEEGDPIDIITSILKSNYKCLETIGGKLDFLEERLQGLLKDIEYQANIQFLHNEETHARVLDLKEQEKSLSLTLSTLSQKVHHLEHALRSITEFEAKAEVALATFVRKAHDLKKIDAKRDDVINCLCQKIESIDQRTKPKEV